MKKMNISARFCPRPTCEFGFIILNRIFRLRSCQIGIDGNFSQPCQMFFKKKCVAPCVREICSQPEYLGNVQALRLFLRNDKKEFESFVIAKINEFSESLEFEKAACWRDIWRETQSLEQDKKLAIRLDEAVDTYSIEETNATIIVRLLTTRGRRFLGDREFVFPKTAETSTTQALEIVINSFYNFNAPREIRLPSDFARRKEFEANLQAKFGRKVKISIIKNELNMTAQMRIKRMKLASNLEKIGGKMSADEILAEIKKILNLRRRPKSIEAFDVAHLANTDFITASVVWENGEIRREKSLYWKIDAENELQAMAEGVKKRLENSETPDVILIDGGRGQLNAVLREIGDCYLAKTTFVSAVKPPGKHREISHFLTASGAKINFVAGDKIFELLRNLRDAAHQTANDLHRQYRDNKYIFGVQENNSNTAEIPLVVVRYDEIGGAAEDLQPIRSSF